MFAPRFITAFLALLLMSALAPRAHAADSTPLIDSIQAQGAHLVVVVSVPVGLKKVTLLGRSRMDGSAWEPRAVARLEGAGGRVTFRLPNSDKLEFLRIKGEASDPLPAAFYQGTNVFVSEIVNGGLETGAPVASPDGSFGAGDAARENREVEESDIYRVRGNTLYLFNQSRGLQVIDITNPDAPSIRGTFPKAGVGEDLYLLPGNEVVLLAREGCYYWGGNSEVVIVDASGDAPKAVATVGVEGSVVESRLVGTALYIASSSYRRENPSQYEYGTYVTSIDLANPAQPVVRNKIWYSGSSHVISATDRFLFVATQDYRQWGGSWETRSTLNILDCSAPDGTFREESKVLLFGAVQDKFKLNVRGDVLTAVSFRWSGLHTELETFSLANPAAPAKLGSLTVKKGEQLFATQFDGDTLYLVTFERIDPLFIIDLSDPARPQVSGELEVPGWSTYIYPMGDRLIALGIDNTNGWRVALSLFDVSNKANPTLASKVTLDQYSWSEGNSNEKAFKVLEEDGLILLPYTGSTTESWHNRVQLIDFTRDSLTLRGFIDHEVAARRAFLHEERVLSLSSRELLSVNIENRDQPQLTSSLRLSWSVDRVLAAGSHLLQIENGYSGAPRIHVSTKTEPETLVRSYELTNRAPIVSASIEGPRLIVAQQSAQGVAGEGDSKTLYPGLSVTLFDLANLPELPVSGSAQAPGTDTYPPSDYRAIWPSQDVIVFSGQSWGGYWWGLDVIASPGMDMVARPGPGMPWWGGGGSRQLVAFNIPASGGASFASRTELASTNSHSSSAEAFATNGLVFQSHSVLESFLDGTNSYVETKWREVVTAKTNVTTTRVETSPGVFESRNETNVVFTTNYVSDGVITNQYPRYIYANKHMLDVVDYENPAAPTVRRPINIPGELRGLAHGGAVLYTAGQHFSTNQTDQAFWLDASAYDGAAVFLIDSVKLDQWHTTTVWDGGNSMVASRQGGTNSSPRLELYTLGTQSPRLELADTETLSSQAHTLARIRSSLISVGQEEIQVWGVENSQLVLRRTGKVTTCYWFDAARADIDEQFNVWAPLGDYGVGRFESDQP